MKRTYIKMILRSVKGSMARFLSILGIVMIGSGFLAGLLATTPDMELTADRYYREHNIMDVDIKGTLGVTDEDIIALGERPDVARVQGAMVTDIILTGSDGEGRVARIYGMDLSLHQNGLINDFTLVSGRMPKSSGECLLASPNGYVGGHEPGEVYTISSENKNYEDRADTYALDEFTVTGIVNSPLYMSIESEPTSVGSGSVSIILYTFPDAYSLDVYTDAFVSVAGADSHNAFSDEYEALMDTSVDALEALGTERSALRYTDIKTDAQAEIDDARQELSDAKADAQRELADARQELDDAQAKLADAETKLADAQTELDDAKHALRKAQKELDDAIDAQYAQLDSMAQFMSSMQYEIAVQKIEAAREAGQKEIDSARTKISRGENKLADAQSEIDENKQKLADAEQEYADAKTKADTEIADAEMKLADAQTELDELDEAEWYVSDLRDNMSFNSYSSNVEKIAAIARVFPIFLFLVAALVALTTMTRMVEEDRTQIGTLKALGYGNAAIMGYYIGYSVLASLIGSILGMVIGFKTLPVIISTAYSMMYVVPRTVTVFRWNYALIIAPIAIACTTAATLFTCLASLSERPAQLMLPKAPQAGKRILLERMGSLWNKFSFTSKVTARNIFRYKKRLYMTVIGIAGCTSLLLTGFGLKDSISDIVSKQFGELYIYDMAVYVKDGLEPEELSGLTDALDTSAAVDNYAFVHSETAYVEHTGSEKVTLFVPERTDELKQHICLRERKSGADIPFDEDSVVLTEKLAETLGLAVGDSFTLRRDEGGSAQFSVSAIAENYVSNYVFLSTASYEAAYGETPSYLLLYAELNDESEAARNTLSTAILSGDAANTVMFNSTIEESFTNTIKKIDYIVMVLILSAGALAIIVVYNLTNINISERKKELATIKVLGFYEGEVARYIYRETVWLALIGTALGLVFGIWLHSYVVRTAEVGAVMFGRNIYPVSFLLSAVVTMAFTGLVDLVMLPRIRRIDMVESMKAND